MSDQLTFIGVDPLADAVDWKRHHPEAYRALVLWAKEDVANGVRPSMDAYGHLLRRPHMAAKLGLTRRTGEPVALQRPPDQLARAPPAARARHPVRHPPGPLRLLERGLVSDDTTPIYFRVSPAIWRARTWTDDMRLLACYLLTSPHRTLEGLFILPKGYICADLRWSAERLAEPFAGLTADGFIAYDEAAEVCLIVKALKYQRPENPNMDKAAIRRLVTVPASSLDTVFLALGAAVRATVGRTARRTASRNGSANLSSALALLSSTRLFARRVREEPVDKSPAPESPEDPEQGRSIDLEEREPPRRGRAACDGESCQVLAFPSTGFAPLRRAIARPASAPSSGGRWARTGRSTAAGRVRRQGLRGLPGRVSASSSGRSATQLCEKALVAAVASLKGARDVAAVTAQRLTAAASLSWSVTASSRSCGAPAATSGGRSAPKAIGDCLPPAFAQPPGAAKNCEPASVAT